MTPNVSEKCHHCKNSNTEPNEETVALVDYQGILKHQIILQIRLQIHKDWS